MVEKRNTQLVHVPVRLPEGTRVKYVVAEGNYGGTPNIEPLEPAGPIILVDDQPASPVSAVYRKPSLEDRVARLEQLVAEPSGTMIHRRPGVTHVHTLPPGARGKFVGSSGAMVVAGPDIEPYVVHSDGRTDTIKPHKVGVLLKREDYPEVCEASSTFETAHPGDPTEW